MLLASQISDRIPPLLHALLSLHDGEYHVFDFQLYSTDQLKDAPGSAIGINPVRDRALRMTGGVEL